ncbi:MAG: threonine--tRNA ligase [Oscillospiraceae bacterium]|nr:threonine--tRNA ligase [Oscillospiraceae bacterium]
MRVIFKGMDFEVNEGTTLAQVAEKKGIKDVCVGKINGVLSDLRTQIVNSCEVDFFAFDSPEGKKVYWHSSAHILAQAVKRLYPYVKLGVGPAVDSGFYYDFDFNGKGLEKDKLEEIQAEMEKIIKEDLPLNKRVKTKEEAIELMKKCGEIYKLDLISERFKEENKLDFYTQGEYTDLCAGPHVLSTGCIGAVALTKVTGAYWKGDQKNKMLVRIYGVSFPKKSDLEAHLLTVKENYERDHNKIGRKLEYFTTVDYIGQGLPILLPKGARVVQILQRFVEDEEEKRGYLLTKTPFLAKNDLYKISGHWSHYRESMFILGNENKDEEMFALRPMTCPFQFQAYLNSKRSYRDLPMRFNETSTLFRNEQSGEMHGLIRVRQFTISEGHIACTSEQLQDEFKACIDLVKFCLKILDFENDISYRFSKWDKNNKEKYIGSEEEWEKVQDEMRKIIDSAGIDYTQADGEAAFYGPKLDVQFKNVYGKEDTLITIQIDFQLAKRFDMFYDDKDGAKKFPYVIHRTSIGCYERVLAVLLEKYCGAMPLWLAPEQVRILPLGKEVIAGASALEKSLKDFGIIRSQVDLRNEKLEYKIRSAIEQKIPYMLILGKRELESGKISVRHRTQGDLGLMTVEEFVSLALDEIKCKKWV